VKLVSIGVQTAISLDLAKARFGKLGQDYRQIKFAR
jgi:hypothetical protein